MSSTAERLKEALLLKNMKQTDLVKATGIGKSSISTYLSGEYEPKQRNIYKIAKALNVSEAWLMGFDVPMERVKNPDENESSEPEQSNSSFSERDSDPGITLYKKLDEIDKSEVRGTMKQMLKAPKYDKNSEISGTTDKSTKAPQRIFNIAARDGKNYTVELDEEKAKDFQKLLEKDFPDLL